MHFFKHLHTINRHRRLVRKYCFKLGLYWQGLTHDLSKYSPTEFLVGAKFYTGHFSPNKGERDEKGYSESWMHHKGRNRHHYEYWTDYSAKTDNPLEPMEMPVKYFAESIADRIAASRVYHGANYTDGDSLEYFLTREKPSHMHINTYNELMKVLTMLKDKGEDETFEYLRMKLREAKKAKTYDN